MKTLSSNQQAFVKMMTESPDQARRGIDLLLKRSDFDEFFDALSEAGLFDPAQNPSPAPSDTPGLFWVPYWEPLKYLEAVAKVAGEKSDTVLAEKVLGVVRSVSRWRDTDGQVRDNYHSFHTFARIIKLVPSSAVLLDEIDLVPVWLQGRFDNSTVAAALSQDTVRRFTESDAPADWEKALRIIEYCTVVHWIADHRGGDEERPTTVLGDFWLKSLISGAAGPLGNKAGRAAADLFLMRLRQTYSRGVRQHDTWVWRRAIEDHEQNRDWLGAENAFVEGLRDALLSWSQQRNAETQSYVESLLSDEAEIIRRVGIHMLDSRFDLYRDIYGRIVGPGLFERGHLHELYLFLNHHFAEFTEEEKTATLAAIRSLPVPVQSSDPPLALKYNQRQWLSAIEGKGSDEADRWFRELSEEAALGPPFDHPEFHSYTQIRYGTGPTPYSVDELVAFARAGSLVEKLNAFRQTKIWDGPSERSLVLALEEAVSADPETFLTCLPAFLDARAPYQCGIISGFKKLWDAADLTKSARFWHEAWPRLVSFFESLINGDSLWRDLLNEADDREAYSDWTLASIAEILRAGTRRDEKAYAPALLPRTWPLLKTLIERLPPKDEGDGSDPMSRAINSSKGKAIEALIDHALRVCRVSDKETGSHAEAWLQMKPVFDAEIAD